jgi:hypothetical protein
MRPSPDFSGRDERGDMLIPQMIKHLTCFSAGCVIPEYKYVLLTAEASYDESM